MEKMGVDSVATLTRLAGKVNLAPPGNLDD
jgi:hypothetical protein